RRSHPRPSRSFGMALRLGHGSLHRAKTAKCRFRLICPLYRASPSEGRRALWQKRSNKERHISCIDDAVAIHVIGAIGRAGSTALYKEANEALNIAAVGRTTAIAVTGAARKDRQRG